VAADIPPHVARFINDHVDSVELVEVLLLLRRDAARAWTAEQVSEQLYTSPGSAANRLEALNRSGLAARAGEGASATYLYAPADAERDRAATDLEQVYATRRTTVINMIFSKPSDKLRTFADAFRLREDK
jgi:hypothetical protein